jgi:putative transposase
MTLWVANRKVYVAHKLWKAARRTGHDVGRDQVARLMRELGIQGVSRLRKKVFTTQADPEATRASDLVNRNFTATRPKRSVGIRPDLRADPHRDGLRVLHRRRLQPADRRVAGRCEHEDRDGPRCPGDGQGLTRRPPPDRPGDPFGRGIAIHLGALHRAAGGNRRPSIGTVADSYDNALAETTNGLYKAECVYGPDTAGWDDVDELELATLSWVHWFNEDRLHGHCDDVPPAEYEAAFYAAKESDLTEVGIQ